MDVNLTDGNPHQVALYLLDWDGQDRSETITILDANTLNVLDARTVAGFQTGEYLVYRIQGHVLIQFTRLAGANAIANGIFFRTVATVAPPTVTVTSPGPGLQSGTVSVQATATSDAGISSVQFQLNGVNLGPAQTAGSPAYTYRWDTTLTPSGTYSLTAIATDVQGQQTTSAPVQVTLNNPLPTTSVSFVKIDKTTQGMWKGTYGSAGIDIANDVNTLPSYAALNFAGTSQWLWTTTPDHRALQDSQGSPYGKASTFYGVPSFNADLNLTDSAPHQIAMYFLDWDNGGRAETVNIIDPTTSKVLDTRTISDFAAGQYLVWNITGHVVFQFNKLNGANAIVNGVFVDPVSQ